MATFDQLSAEQRAILELILKQGQTYEQLGTMLNMREARVRELACESLVTLSPVSAAAVHEEHRGQITDYLLGQQSEAGESTTQDHMRGSEGARAWSRSVLDSLEQFYEARTLPSIPGPDGDTLTGAAAQAPGKPARKPTKPAGKQKKPAGGQPAPAPQSQRSGHAPAPEQASSPGDPPSGLSPEARAIVFRRRVAAAVVGALCGLALMVWLVPKGLDAVGITGDDDDKTATSKKNSRPRARVVGQLVLRPVEGAEGMGVAAVAQRGKTRSLIVQAQVPVGTNREAYEVWLYNSDRDARSLGAQVTDREGTFQGAGPLPADFSRYKFIDVSRENVDKNAAHSGRSVLRGRMDQFQLPAAGTQRGTPGTETQP